MGLNFSKIVFLSLFLGFWHLSSPVQAFEEGFCRRFIQRFRIRTPYESHVLPQKVKDILKASDLEIIGWKGPIAIVRGNGHFTGSSLSVIDSLLNRPRDLGRLTLRMVQDPTLQKEHGGIIVYAFDRSIAEVIFVAVPEGSEENNRKVLEAAREILKSPTALRAPSN